MIGCAHPFLDQDNVWIQLRNDYAESSDTRILFLDRDGVIVDEVDYLHRVEDIRFIPGVEDTICTARHAGWRVVIVTNQAGIGRGYYGWEEFSVVNTRILEHLDAAGANIDLLLAVPHHKGGKPPLNHPNHHMRKPNPGMLLKAAEILSADLASSIVVGDNDSDIEAGLRAGLRKGFHVLTGHGQDRVSTSEKLSSTKYPVEVIYSIADIRLRDYLSKQIMEEVR